MSKHKGLVVPSDGGRSGVLVFPVFVLMVVMALGMWSGAWAQSLSATTASELKIAGSGGQLTFTFSGSSLDGGDGTYTSGFSLGSGWPASTALGAVSLVVSTGTGTGTFVVTIPAGIAPTNVTAGELNVPAALSVGSNKITVAADIAATEILSASLTLTGTTPSLEATATKTINAGTGYTGVITAWAPNHPTFESGEAYTATVTLTATTGYTFPSGSWGNGTKTGVKLGGKDADVTACNNATVTMTFTFDAVTAIPLASGGTLNITPGNAATNPGNIDYTKSGSGTGWSYSIATKTLSIFLGEIDADKTYTITGNSGTSAEAIVFNAVYTSNKGTINWNAKAATVRGVTVPALGGDGVFKVGESASISASAGIALKANCGVVLAGGTASTRPELSAAGTYVIEAAGSVTTGAITSPALGAIIRHTASSGSRSQVAAIRAGAVDIERVLITGAGSGTALSGLYGALVRAGGDVTLTGGQYGIANGDAAVFSGGNAALNRASVSLGTGAGADAVAAVSAAGNVDIAAGGTAAADTASVTAAGSAIAVNAGGDVAVRATKDRTARVAAANGMAIFAAGGVALHGANVTAALGTAGQAVISAAGSVTMGDNSGAAGSRVATVTNTNTAAAAAVAAIRSTFSGGAAVELTKACSIGVAGSAAGIITTAEGVSITGAVEIRTNNGRAIDSYGAVAINNDKARLISSGTGTDAGNVISALDAIAITAVDSISAAGGAGTAARAAVYSFEGGITIEKGVIHSAGGTAVWNDDPSGSVTIGGSSGSHVRVRTGAAGAAPGLAAVYSLGDVVVGEDAQVLSVNTGSNAAKAIIAAAEAGVTVNAGAEVKTTTGSAIDVYYGTFEMDGGAVSSSNNPAGVAVVNVQMFNSVKNAGNGDYQVEISGGTITAGGAGPAVKVAGRAKVSITGEDDNVLVSAAGGRAVEAANDSVVVAGHNTNKVKIASATGSAVYANSGTVWVKGENVEVSVTGAGAANTVAAIQTVSGNVLLATDGDGGDALVISAAGNAAGINAGGNVEAGLAAYTGGAAKGTVGVTAASGIAVKSAKTAMAIGQPVSDELTVRISSKSGTAIEADSVYISLATVTAESGVAVSGRKVHVVNAGSKILAGKADDNTLGAATVTGTAIAGTGTAATDSVKVEGGEVKAYGSGTAVTTGAGTVIAGNGGSAVNVIIEAGNGGKAINSVTGTVVVRNNTSGTTKVRIAGEGAAGTAITTGGDVFVNGAAAAANAVVEANNGGTAIHATASGAVSPANPQRFVKVAYGTVRAGEGGTAIKSADRVIDSLTGAAAANVEVAAGFGGAGIDAAGRVHIGGGTITLEPEDTAGTAVRTTGSGAAVTVGSGDNLVIIKSNATGIAASGAAVTIKNDAKLSGVIDADMTVEDGKTVTLALGSGNDYRKLVIAKTASVGKAGKLALAAGDSVAVTGKLNTVPSVSPLTSDENNRVTNAGVVIVEAGGELVYAQIPAKAEATYLNTGRTILKAGGKVNGSVLERVNADSAKTFLVHARNLNVSGRMGSSGSVTVPPTFSADTSYARVDTVFRVIGMSAANYLDRAYTTPNNYGGSPEYGVVSGSLPAGQGMAGKDTVIFLNKEDGVIAGMLTKAGAGKFTVEVKNDAGADSREFAFDVRRDSLRLNDYFEGVVVNAAGDTAALTASVPYTGAAVAVHIRGKALPNNYTGRYDGLGSAMVFNYTGEGSTAYGPTSAPPRDAGTYSVVARFSQSGNFNVMPANAVLSGTFTIEPASLSQLLGGNTTVNYYVPAGKAIENLEVPLPNIRQYGASYGGVTLQSAPEGFIDTVGLESPYAVIAGDSVLVVSLTANSVVNNSAIYNISVDGGENVAAGGMGVRVNIQAANPANLIESEPNVKINFAAERLDGFIAGRSFEVTVDGAVETVKGAAFTAIREEWFGRTASIITLPSSVYMFPSDGQTVAIPARPDAPEGIEADDDEGAIAGTTAAMEYRAVGGVWTTASDNGTPVANGTYEVRVKATSASFAGEAVTVVVNKTVSVAQTVREVRTDEAAVVAPVNKYTAEFTAGPNPVSQNAGRVTFFWQGAALSKGSLKVFDANGNVVKTVSISDKAASSSARREVGAWKLDDAKGRSAADGTYVVKGVLVARDGSKIKVSHVVSVQ